jgi:membrane peptidoglycan carboxypeptidase
MHRSTRRRWLWLALAAIVSAGVAVAVVAWFASLTPTRLAPHVHSRLQRTHAKAVPLDAIAPILREAVVATEDERFYRHHGIDVLGVLRALPYDVVHLSFAQGASTITEQVGKLLYLRGNDHTPWRKLEDAALALKLEDRYRKEQILDAYLNSAYFGEGAYGARAASERYFGVPPRRLGAAQASLLAGLIQAPSAYDPRLHPELARARQADVLRSLVRDGFLTEAEAVAAIDRPLRLLAGSPLPPLRGVDLSPGPAFVWWELVLGAIMAALGVVALVASRLPRFRVAYGVVAIRALSLVLALLGAGAIVRSFRSV